MPNDRVFPGHCNWQNPPRKYTVIPHKEYNIMGFGLYPVDIAAFAMESPVFYLVPVLNAAGPLARRPAIQHS